MSASEAADSASSTEAAIHAKVVQLKAGECNKWLGKLPDIETEEKKFRKILQHPDTNADKAAKWND